MDSPSEIVLPLIHCGISSRASLAAPVPQVSLLVPQQCPLCTGRGGVRLQTTVRGGRVQLQWYCVRCEAEWPVTRAEAAGRPPEASVQ
jgi:hypothetical protein